MEKCTFCLKVDLAHGSSGYFARQHADPQDKKDPGPWFCHEMCKHMWEHTLGISMMPQGQYEEQLEKNYKNVTKRKAAEAASAARIDSMAKEMAAQEALTHDDLGGMDDDDS